MATQSRSFVVLLTVFTLVCGGLLAGVLLLISSPITLHYPVVLLYFAGITGVLHAWQEKGALIDPKIAVRRFMAALAIKLFLSMTVLMVLLLTAPKEIRLPLGLAFAFLYLSFLVFSTLRSFNLSK
ncbi:MAG TPA: hypothetical protein PK149_08590 [Flavobacteriales bacterium]|nr:hypothetical protein [Flavobacteriales bacterium]